MLRKFWKYAEKREINIKLGYSENACCFITSPYKKINLDIIYFARFAVVFFNKVSSCESAHMYCVANFTLNSKFDRNLTVIFRVKIINYLKLTIKHYSSINIIFTFYCLSFEKSPSTETWKSSKVYSMIHFLHEDVIFLDPNCLSIGEGCLLNDNVRGMIRFSKFAILGASRHRT